MNFRAIEKLILKETEHMLETRLEINPLDHDIVTSYILNLDTVEITDITMLKNGNMQITIS